MGIGKHILLLGRSGKTVCAWCSLPVGGMDEVEIVTHLVEAHGVKDLSVPPARSKRTKQVTKVSIKVESYEEEDQSMNGVKVIVRRFPSGGTVVNASCQCFGTRYRAHSRMDCVNRREGRQP